MKEIINYILLLVLIPKGYTITQCAIYEDTNLNCTFSRNINATQTGFRVYFNSDNGNEELLIDCVWMHGELQCLKQEGFQYKQPVSEIAEIIVPTRLKGRSGTYICIDDRPEPEDAMRCRFNKSQQERQREIQHVNQTSSKILSDDKDTQANNTAVIASSVCGVVAFIALVLIIMVMYRKRLKKSPKIPRSERLIMDRFRVSLLQAEERNNGKLEHSRMTFPPAYSSRWNSSKNCYKSSSTNYSIINENNSCLKKTQTL